MLLDNVSAMAHSGPGMRRDGSTRRRAAAARAAAGVPARRSACGRVKGDGRATGGRLDETWSSTTVQNPRRPQPAARPSAEPRSGLLLAADLCAPPVDETARIHCPTAASLRPPPTRLLPAHPPRTPWRASTCRR